MLSADTITFFHAPQSRSTGVLTLLEELGAPYELQVLNMKAGEQRQAAYLMVNPLGKVPAIRHGEALVTEQVAIFIYLADLFAKAGLAPPIGDARRGPYLRWMVYYAACFEPAIIDRATKREPAPLAMSPYGDFDTMFGTVLAQLARSPYLLGETVSAADILWGVALGVVLKFNLVPESPVLRDYAGRVAARASCVKATAKDAELAAAQEAAQKPAPAQG
ncbi:MAG: glutathione S-transferase [Proteobacteria bacterium]|nr:glutathione S-transferase [Pseudomonadota bacterium]